MYSRTHFLGLARELRDLIYKHYVTLEGGYILDFNSGKLRTTEAGCIDLALMYTCNQIAKEMHGVALGNNTITCSTGYSNETREKAGHFNFFIEYTDEVRSHLVRKGFICLTQMTANCIAQEFPQFSDTIHRLQAEGGPRELVEKNWGEAPSTHRRFVAYALALVAKHQDFANVISSRSFLSSKTIYGTLPLEISPWLIPTHDDIPAMTHALSRELSVVDYWKRKKYRYSAAAVIIRFLNSIPLETRLQIRDIALLEDLPAVAYPECHAQGLIPFCLENLRLRIERKVSLWRNAFSKGSVPLFSALRKPTQLNPRLDCLHLNSDQITDSLAPWITEAIALPSYGMPAGSFTLVLDGDPIPSRTSEVFDIVQRDAAWQAALDQCYDRNIFPSPSWFDRRRHRCYRFENFPKVLADISEGKSIVRCNFDVGQPWSVERVIESHKYWTTQMWAKEWRAHEPLSFETEPPLPKWLDMRREEALPEETTGLEVGCGQLRSNA